MTQEASLLFAIQKKFKAHLHHLLQWQNAEITTKQFLGCLLTTDKKKIAKLRDRLFVPGTSDRLIWKPRCNDKQALLSLVGEHPLIDISRLISVYESSKQITSRTAFPFIAPSNHRSKQVPLEKNEPNPVLGVDILVRPPTKFSDDDAPETRNTLHVGRQFVIVVIHGNFMGDCLQDDSDSLVRMIAGDAIFEKMGDEIVPAAIECENEAKPLLFQGELEQATKIIARHLNNIVKAAVHAGAKPADGNESFQDS